MNNSVISLLLFYVLLGCGSGTEIPGKAQWLRTGIPETQPTSPKEPENIITDTSITRILGLSYDVTDIPKEIKYSGKIVGGAKWEDRNGANILLITETSEKQSPGGFREKELYAYHFISENYTLLWRINDFIKECEFDVTLEYIQGSLSISDLDDNGTAESSFLYKLSCRSDVSPNGLKLIMHEGDRKYAIRGETRVRIGDEPPFGGTMKIDTSFDEAPHVFLEYAKAQWSKFQAENY